MEQHLLIRSGDLLPPEFALPHPFDRVLIRNYEMGRYGELRIRMRVLAYMSEDTHAHK